MNTFDQIIKRDTEIKQDTPFRPKFLLNGSGCRSKSIYLPIVAYRVSIYVGFLCRNSQESHVIMITASHNPADENGIKLGTACQSTISDEILEQIQKGLNSDSEFKDFLKKNFQNNEKELTLPSLNYVYVGMDCRTSSPELYELIREGLQSLNMKYINIGRCSTPELFSFSKEIWENFQKNGNIEDLQLKSYYKFYVNSVLDKFEQGMKMIKNNEKIMEKPKVYMDFANGCGAVSFAAYKQRLLNYFDITTEFDNDFDFPNRKCGAEYLYVNWDTQSHNKKYKNFDYCFFFDGDSDRIIGKISDFNEPIDGNAFLLLYYRALNKILTNVSQNSMDLIKATLGQDFQVRLIGNINTNLGVAKFMKKNNKKLQIANIGIQNLYNQAKNNSLISAFFEPNGHGGIYYHEKFNNAIKLALQKETESVPLRLLDIFNNILKNNSRGYALHNFLIFFLCHSYLESVSNSEKNPQVYSLKHLYRKYKQVKKDFHVANQHKNNFANSAEGKGTLMYPQDLVENIKEVYQKIKNLQGQQQQLEIEVQIRKSATEDSLIRMHVQAPILETCVEFSTEVEILMDKYLIFPSKLQNLSSSRKSSSRLSTTGDESEEQSKI